MRSSPSEFRVFLSSTFHDLREERDHLTKKVFPEIRRKCRERGIEFTEVDLRWGVTDEAARAGLVLRTCLEEIDNCRPFFLGIVGNRYGWVPTREDVAGDVNLFQDYPLLTDLIDNGASATEIEMHYGVFQVPPEREMNSFFCIRDGGTPLAEDNAEKLAKLRNTIHEYSQRRPTSISAQHFSNPTIFGELVREELLRLLDIYWPASEDEVWLDREAQEHEAFAVSRRRGYLPDPDSVRWLDDYLRDKESRALFVSAPPGSGKSSLIAHWSAVQRLRGEKIHVIEHYVGATSGGADHLMIIQRIIGEIARTWKLSDEIPTDPQQLVEQFPFWLAKVVDHELIIFIDALDQLNGVAGELEWLPKYLPDHVRLIVSAAGSEQIQLLRQRRWPEYQLQPLSHNYRELIVKQYLGSFSKKLSDSQQERITRSEKCANPLFLRTVLEELRVLGIYEQLDAEIDKYLNAKDLLALFEMMLERIERDFGENVVAVMSFLAVSPSGLTESELIELSRLSRAELSTLVNALDYHLIRHSGALSFFHPLFAKAAESRYVTADLRKEGQIELLRLFSRDRLDIRSLRIRLTLLKELTMWRELVTTLSDLRIFEQLNASQTKYELFESWQLALKHVKENRSIASYYLASVQHAERDERNADTMLDAHNALLSLAEFIRDCGDYAGAENFAKRSLQETSRSEKRRIECLKVAANIQLHLTKPLEAEPLLEEALTGSLKVFGPDHPMTLKIENEKVWLLQLKGHLQESVILAEALTKKYESVFGSLSPETAHSRSHLGVLLKDAGKPSEAYEQLSAVVGILRTVYGSRFPDTAGAIHDLSQVAQELGNYDEAEQLLAEGSEILQALLGREHPHVAQAIANHAFFLSKRGNMHEAEKLYVQAIELQSLVHGADSANVAPTMNNYAMLLSRLGKFTQAEQMFLRSIGIWRRTLGPKHPSISFSLNGLGTAMIEAGNYEKAASYLQEAIELRMEVMGAMHPSTLKTLHTVGVLYKQQGMLSEAEKAFNDVLESRVKVLGSDHIETGATSHELGELYLEEGRYEEADPLLQKAYAIRSRVLGDEHTDTAKTISCLGKLHVHAGKAAHGHEMVKLAHAIHHRIMGPDHPDTKRLWQRIEALQHIGN